MNGNFKQLIELHQQHQMLETTWYRNLLTLAAGALALMATVGPTDLSTSHLARYLLVATWVCLGIGILSGAGTTYLEVDRSKNLWQAHKAELQRSLAESRTMKIVSANPSTIFVHCKRLMVVSLLLAVVCLVSYMVLATLT